MMVKQIHNHGPADENNFFEIHKIHVLNQSLFASIHFTGEAQLWFYNFKKKNRAPTWEELKHNLCLTFGPHVFEGYYGDLTRLQQIGTV